MKENISVLIPEEEIDKRVRELAAQITKDCAGKDLIIICILKGASFFACDLAKRIELPTQLEFMRCASYGDSDTSSGNVKVIMDLDHDIAGRDVLVVEDIVDTGRTLKYLMELLSDRKPSSIRLVSLLDKPERRVVDIKADYVGFTIPDEFVVGYGLDYAQKHRGLPFIGVIKP
ncbi:MAG: hypoxanthine phosphoribosyltransferase [Lachnospiraceae bacterium]|nr:hypoxanthine phosphoribosyltransferase [Lachnospiraceae bacterium]